MNNSSSRENSITDGEVCDWVHQHVKNLRRKKAAHWQDVLTGPLAMNAAAARRFKLRKEQSASPTATSSRPSWIH